jgi:hypothetical protein
MGTEHQFINPGSQISPDARFHIDQHLLDGFRGDLAVARRVPHAQHQPLTRRRIDDRGRVSLEEALYRQSEAGPSRIWPLPP